MKRFILLMLLLLVSAVVTQAQVRGRPTPTPLSESEKLKQQATDISNRSRGLRNVENNLGNDQRSKEGARTFRQAIKPLYRKAKKSEISLLAPKKEYSTKYSKFLKSKKSGLIKLVLDKGCADVVNVVDASKECSSYPMPGAGSSYSFRIKNYRLKNLGDLNYTGKYFQALGVLLHGVMVNIGNVPLEKVDSNTKGYKFVKDFKPADDFKKAADFADKLRKGIKYGDFTYASILPAQVNSTYILRSIAYRGVAPRVVNGITYNELDFDKRKDITVAFQILEKDNESITILWKELANKKSPKLEAK